MVTALKSDHSISGSSATSDLARIFDHFRSHTAIITPERAGEILDTQNWVRQRDVSAQWVQDLTLAILKGELTFLSIVYAEMPDSTKHLVDGQHRLTALRALDRPLPATVITHRVSDDAELGALYLKYDRSRARGPEVGLRAMGILDQTDIEKGFVRRLGGAVHILNSGFSRSYRQDKSLITRSLAVGEWLTEIAAYETAISGNSAEVRSKLMRAPVGAVALATFRHQTGMAEEFWTRTASQEMLGTDDPRRRLMNWLRDNIRTNIGSDILYCRYVAATWNAFFEGRTLKLLKVGDPSAPVRISGTPYQGAPR